MGAPKTQHGRGQDGRRDKGDHAPQQIARSRCGAKEVTQEQREAALGTTGATGQRHGGAQQLNKGASGHNREKVEIVLAKGEHQKVRDEVEECELHHGDNHGERHGREVSGRTLELFGKRMNLAVHKDAPALDLRRRHADALEPIDNAMGNAGDGFGHKRDGEDAEQDKAMAAKAKDAQQRHVAIALGEKRHACKQEDGTPCYQAKLVDDKTRKLRRAGLAHIEAGPGQAIDLRRRGSDHHGRKVAKEDAARLDRDKVANTDGRLRIDPYGNSVGDNAKNQVHQHAQTCSDEPWGLNGRHGGPELPHLPGYNQIDDVAHQHDADENSAATRALGVIAARDLNLNLGLMRMLRGLNHEAPS